MDRYKHNGMRQQNEKTKTKSQGFQGAEITEALYRHNKSCEVWVPMHSSLTKIKGKEIHAEY